MDVLMELREVQLVENPNSVQVVILGEVGGERTIEIGIAQYEAIQLDMALHNERYPRPLTHDLVLNTIYAMGGTLDRVLVDDLRMTEVGLGGTFFGKLVVKSLEGAMMLVDSRPSDAIVLATKTGAPIFVAEKVLHQCAE